MKKIIIEKTIYSLFNNLIMEFLTKAEFIFLDWFLLSLFNNDIFKQY